MTLTLLEGAKQLRLCCAPIHFQGMEVDQITKDNIVWSPDTIAFIYHMDPKVSDMQTIMMEICAIHVLCF